MRLGTYGWEVGVGVDGRPVTLAGTYYDALNAANPRVAGMHSLKINSESGIPNSPSANVNTGASMAKLWTFEQMLAQSPEHPDAQSWFNHEGCIMRLYVRWNTGDLPSAGKAVEFLQLATGTTIGRAALCIDSSGYLHFRRQTRALRFPTPDPAVNPTSTILPSGAGTGWRIGTPLPLNTWTMIEVAFLLNMTAIRVNEQLWFVVCYNPTSSVTTVFPDIKLGWGMVYQAGAVVTNAGSMGANKNVYFDDVAINDRYDDGGGQDVFPGPGCVRSFRPLSDHFDFLERPPYSWVPGGPQCIWRGVPNGSLGNAAGQVPHPPPSPTPSGSAFSPALRLAPMHPPSGPPSGGRNDFGGVDPVTLKQYGLSLDNVSAPDVGVICFYQGFEPGMNLVHSPSTEWVEDRNKDGFGQYSHDYMITSGGSDWRGAPSFPKCVDWQFVYPRGVGDIDRQIKTVTDPIVPDGEMAVMHSWYGGGIGLDGSRPLTSTPPPSDEATLHEGLKVWAPGVQDEPTDTPWQAVSLVQLRWPSVRSVGPTYNLDALPGDPRLFLSRTKSIAPAGPGGKYAVPATVQALTCYGAGLILEDQAGATAPLPETCKYLLMVV